MNSDNKHLLDDKYSFKELVDIDQLREMFERFSMATGFTTGIVSYPEQELLIATGWRDICVKFHRVCPASEKHCKQSNIELTAKLKKHRELNICPCENGLVDGATPIIIEGVHMASLATGQILFERPNIEQFRKQAEEYHYDKNAYLEALREVPVTSEAVFQNVMRFLSGMATMLAEQGLKEIRRKRAEKEIRRMQRMEELGMVAGGIAHDFNNLLTGIFGNLELARIELPEGSQANSCLKKAHNAIQNARQLTGQLLTFAKGGIPVLDTVETAAFVRDTVDFNLHGSNVLANFDLPDSLWSIKADKGQIGQVLANLTINAKQAMPGIGTLHVKCRNIPRAEAINTANLTGESVRITIRDEGTGIPSKIIEHIFDPYFSTKQKGHGLGLAIVHSIIEQHNGRIDVSSTPDVGTTFTVFLPALPRSKPEDTKETYRTYEEAEATRPLHVLLMDDEEMIRDVGIQMLEFLEYTSTDTAVNGNEALEKYAAAMENGTPFDLVIMDLTIRGGKGGREIIGELLKIDPDVRVIVASGYASDPVMANHRDFGFSGKLEKPFEIAELKREIARVMEEG